MPKQGWWGGGMGPWGSACLPRKQLVQELLGSGEGRVGGHKGGDVGHISTWESWHYGCCYLRQCASLEARILQASCRLNVNSAAHWVGQRGISHQHHHESPGGLRSRAHPGTPSPSRTCAGGGTGVPTLNKVLGFSII